MGILYDFFILLMQAYIKVSALFNAKSHKWIEGRRNIFKRLAETIDNTADIAWFHAASLGEFEQGRPVIEAFRKANPNYKILLTFFSPSGYEIRKNYDGADWIFYLPADTSSNAKRFIKIVNPKVVVFIKYEFWANLLKYAHRSGANVYVISAIFRRNSAFFKWYGGRYRKILKYFNHIFVQNEESKTLLAELNIDNVTVAGDTRFDRVYSIAAQAKEIPAIERFAASSKVLVAGSTWQPDEEILKTLIEQHRDMKFIIAPHEIHPERIAGFIASVSRPAVRYTQIDENTDLAAADLLFIDTIGILSSVYRYGWCAYIGGGFGVGIHNILEAATFGLPLAFGPNYQKFKEARDLVALGGATSISDYQQLNGWLTELNHDRASEVCRTYVAENRGATDKIISEIKA